MEELKRMKRELVHKGHVIDYYHDTILAGGKERIYDYIYHNGAAAIIAVNEEGKILLVRQYRNAIDRFTLEIPAGGRNEGEDPKCCAIRECEEETGYRPVDAEHLIDIFTSVAFCNEKIHIYYTNHLVKSKQNLDEGEYVNVEAYSLTELVDMIIQGKINDSKTIAAILAYKNKYSL